MHLVCNIGAAQGAFAEKTALLSKMLQYLTTAALVFRYGLGWRKRIAKTYTDTIGGYKFRLLPKLAEKEFEEKKPIRALFETLD
ncbi:jg15960 [Pararge aegeria aegeria]|uniref:Jg15960 protein n=1 Tax=Pararge aegeria aegeria TaxID=348720 RepID=A0A8S4R681_9NEOP|nr:jg15960 [Pararge aegeria aegeria]